MLHVCLYTRRGCRHCDTVAPLLDALRSEFSFTLETVDVARDPDLLARFGCSVPVVTVDGGNRVAARVTTERLRAALARAEQRRQAQATPQTAT